MKTLNPSTFFKYHHENCFVYLIPASLKTLNNKEFHDKLKRDKLVLRIVKKYKLGICAARDSKWKDYLEHSCRGTILEKVPFAVFNYAFDDVLQDSVLLNTESQFKYLITVDDFDSQKILLKKDVCLSWATPNEYKMFFQTKDHSIDFYANSLCIEPNFYYCAIISEAHASSELIQDFLTEFLKQYC